MRRGLLRDGVPGIPGGDAGGPSVPHHIQCGGGRSGLTLCRSDVIASGWVGQARTGGMAPKHSLLRGLWYGSVIRPRIASEGFQHPGSDIQSSGLVE